MVKKTIVSLSFDDGREDTYRNAYMIMKKYGLKGTIHITTGYVDGSWKPENWCTSNSAITVDQLIEMKKYGFEISSHGDKHMSDKKDFFVSTRKMKKWGIVDENIGFSIPNSKLLPEEKKEFTQYLIKNDVEYMRGGRSPKCYSFKAKIFYVLYNILKIQFFYQRFNQHNCIDINGNTKLNKYDLNSVVIRIEDDSSMVIKFIERNVNKKNWIILMIHSILDKDEGCYGKDPWCWDTINFEHLCKQLKCMMDTKKILILPIIEFIHENQE